MFWEAAAMQLSAANLLLTAQQVAHQARQPAPDAKAFLGSLSQSAKEELFAPLEFQQTSSPSTHTPATPARNPEGKLGASLDILI
jgi:hypothetical protein